MGKNSHLVARPLYQTVRQTSPQVQKIRQKTMTRKIQAVEALLQPNQFQSVQAEPEVVRVTRPEVVVRAPPAVNHIVQIQNHPQGSPLPKVVLRVAENKKKLPKKKKNVKRKNRKRLRDKDSTSLKRLKRLKRLKKPKRRPMPWSNKKRLNNNKGWNK